MEQDKQQKPLMTEEQKRMLMQAKIEHEQQMQNDPEYRKLWEKRERELQKFIFPGDNIED